MPEHVGSLSPHTIFTVSDSLRYLEPQQLEVFLQSFNAWCAATDRQEYVRSRQRMRALFLLLRFTGARLGEVLTLDDRTAFDFSRKIVCLGHGETKRDVPLETFASDSIQEVLESSMGYSLRGHFFSYGPGVCAENFLCPCHGLRFAESFGNAESVAVQPCSGNGARRCPATGSQ
ncbi:hypothetical protein [Halodesulfovibrio sp. MK-HDV]|uniref:hypothetical protein n=1 Tax=Halodesulfovibrio sp. MK-HDV TaxID=2599925 RepID=UPI0013704B5F|nr:hypothetical protein [Halodesulfovibrio sp. MK-HDV]KAF1073726.1 hypothetical protein MKHDV_03347 [Halodesulfovibrio sp. MK-HDV]